MCTDLRGLAVLVRQDDGLERAVDGGEALQEHRDLGAATGLA